MFQRGWSKLGHGIAAQLVGTVLVCGLPAEIWSQAPPQHQAPAWNVSIGAGGFVVPKYAGSDEYRVLPFPMVSIEYQGRVFLGGTPGGVGAGLGLHLVRTPDLTISATVGGTDTRPEDRGDALAGLGDRGIGVFTGGVMSYRLGAVRASVAGSVGLTDGTGAIGDASLGVGGRLGGRWFGNLGVGATVATAEQMRYEFGVTDSQAGRRGRLFAEGDTRLRAEDLGTYEPEAGLQSVRAQLSLGYLLSRRWTAIGFASVSRLEGDAAASPLVREPTSVAGGVGLTYRF